MTDDPARSFLRPRAASGAEHAAVGCIGLTWGMLPRLARHSFSGSFEVQTVGGRRRRTGGPRDDARKGQRKMKLRKTPRRWSPGCRRPAPWPPGPRSADTPRRGWRGSERCPGRSGTEAGEAGRYFLPGNPPATVKTGVGLDPHCRQRTGNHLTNQ